MYRRFPLIVLLLLGCACGSRAVPLTASGAISPAPGASPSAVASGGPRSEGSAEPGGHAAATDRGREARGRDGVDYGPMGPADFNDMPLTVRLSAECATPGQTMQATAVTLANAKLAFTAAYSDNDFVPNFTYVPGESNPTGTFTWSWQILPNTPRGDAVVNVLATKEDRAASYQSGFRVADSC